MQPLSAILPAMKSPEDLQKALSHGLTPSDGQSTTALQIRQAPLTEKQLMRIHSAMLAKPPSIISAKRKKYGRKIIRDEFGEYVDNNAVIGEEDSFSVDLSIMTDAPLEVFDSALRPSPPESIVTHLKRLATHKRFGSDTINRAVLFNDYVVKLRGHSEFAIYLACRHVWENSDSDFAPNLGKLAALVEEIEDSIAYHRSQLERMAEKRIEAMQEPKPDARLKMHWKELGRRDWLPIHWEQYINEAERMIGLAQQNPHTFNREEWEKLYARRQHEHFEFLRGKS